MTDRASKSKGLVWVLVACGLGVAFALGLSPLAHVIPWSWEKKLGYTLELGILQSECRNDARAQTLLQRLVKRIYPIRPEDAAFSIDVRVVKDESVNAYATLGGKIFLNSGLLKQAESPEEIAGVLAHEITHVEHRHIMEAAITHLLTSEGLRAMFGANSSAAEWTQYFLKMDFTRSQEEQADEGGLERLQKAHVDNRGLKRLFERMEASGGAPDFLSDHPSTPERIKGIERFANRDTEPLMTQDEWKALKNYCNESQAD